MSKFTERLAVDEFCPATQEQKQTSQIRLPNVSRTFSRIRMYLHARVSVVTAPIVGSKSLEELHDTISTFFLSSSIVLIIVHLRSSESVHVE